MKPNQRKYQDPTRKDWILGTALLLVYVIVIGVGAIYLIPEYWYVRLLLFLFSTVYVNIKQNRNYACRCRECGHGFDVSFFVNLISLHGIDREGSWQMVKCLNCNKRAKAAVIKVTPIG
jgi:hypothetical protein